MFEESRNLPEINRTMGSCILHTRFVRTWTHYMNCTWNPCQNVVQALYILRYAFEEELPLFKILFQRWCMSFYYLIKNLQRCEKPNWNCFLSSDYAACLKTIARVALLYICFAHITNMWDTFFAVVRWYFSTFHSRTYRRLDTKLF